MLERGRNKHLSRLYVCTSHLETRSRENPQGLGVSKRMRNGSLLDFGESGVSRVGGRWGCAVDRRWRGVPHSLHGDRQRNGTALKRTRTLAAWGSLLPSPP
jgi:hypothetical protein